MNAFWHDLFRRKKAPAVETGEWGELLAEKMLRGKNYAILGRRIRVGGSGELDIVAREGDVLVFVEVKTRKDEVFARPIEAVDARKRRMLSRAAVRYLRRLGYPRVNFRFDVVEVIGDGTGQPVIRHAQNVFSLDRRYSLPR